jgi:RimJ/RimL family protein N-acetyltransferase
MHPITNKALQTERMVLRMMEMADVDDLMGIFSDPVAMRYYPSTKSRQEAQEWVRRVQERAIEIAASVSGWQSSKTRASSWDSAASPYRK